jgi:hypothetical protein
MKKVFANRDCIILVLEKGETIKTDGKFLAEMAREVGPTTMNTIVGRMNLAQEIWLYDQPTKLFHAWKNKGHINEIIHRMAEQGINVKISAARLDAGTASEVRFCENKDEFLFNLKYL